MEISEVFKIAEKQLNQTNTELEFKKVNEDEKSITFAGEKGAYRIAYDMQASTMAFECCYDYEADEPKFETISRSLYDAETYNEKDAKSLGNEINDEISGIFKARKQVNLDKVKMPKAVSRTKAKTESSATIATHLQTVSAHSTLNIRMKSRKTLLLTANFYLKHFLQKSELQRCLM